MANLLEETIKILNDCGKTEDDVLWVGCCEDWASCCPDVKNTWEWFKSKADFEYDDGYGHEEINMSLVVVGKDFWLERNNYDGSEWWEFKQMPVEPFEVKDFWLRGDF